MDIYRSATPFPLYIDGLGRAVGRGRGLYTWYREEQRGIVRVESLLERESLFVRPSTSRERKKREKESWTVAAGLQSGRRIQKEEKRKGSKVI